MISSDTMRGFNDLLILHLLSLEDSYGYALSKRISELSEGQYNIKETTLYSAFNRMERQGWNRGYDGLETHGRMRTYFAITDLGRHVLADKRVEWTTVQRVMKNILEAS
jgi:PadR family transcriptional regulator PadR